jgi:hypothetical protein
MDVKLDKETIIKHRFWFSLPCIALCILIAWGCEVRVRSESARKYKMGENHNSELRTLAGDPLRRNDLWNKAVTGEKKDSDKERARLWFITYDQQNDVIPLRTNADMGDNFKPLEAIRDPVITWPREWVDRWNRSNVDHLRRSGREGYSLWQNPDPKTNPNAAKVLDFGEDLLIIPEESRGFYRDQFNEVVDKLKWYDGGSRKGAIRTPDPREDHRGYAMTRLLNRQDLSAEKVTSEEAWTLQQDLAIRRELFVSLAEVMNAYSQCYPEWIELVPPKSKTNVQKIGDRQTFYNATWNLGLPKPEGAAAANFRYQPLAYDKGWELRLEMRVDGQKVLLGGSSLNHGELDIPASSLQIYFLQKASNQEVDTPLVLAVPAQKGTKAAATETKLTEVPLPKGADMRISRIRRVNTEKVLDYSYCGNAEWHLHLRLIETTGNETLVRGELINRSSRRQLVPAFELELIQSDNNEAFKEEMRLQIDAINAGDSRPFEYSVRKKAKGLRQVTQVLDWRTSPIKRIDVIEVGANAHRHSDRTKIQPLKAYDFKKKDPKPQPVATVPDPNTGGNMGPSSTGMGGSVGKGSGDGTAEGKFSENHKLPLSIYLDVTDELRRLPVAMVLVLREDCVNDVQNALANSRIRFQVTQTAMNRLAGLPRPGTGSDSGSGMGGGAPAAGGMGGMGPQMPSAPGGEGGVIGGKGGGRGADQPPMTGGGSSRGGQSWAEDTGNLVELQVYGLVTLYECPDAVRRIQKARDAANAAQMQPTQ